MRWIARAGKAVYQLLHFVFGVIILGAIAVGVKAFLREKNTYRQKEINDIKNSNNDNQRWLDKHSARKQWNDLRR